MNDQEIVRIPISEIRLVNPRSRNRARFESIVTSIAAIGLKRPITVASRESAPDGTSYDLVCGQGRLEAFIKLGEQSIPAIVMEGSLEDQYLRHQAWVCDEDSEELDVVMVVYNRICQSCCCSMSLWSIYHLNQALHGLLRADACQQVLEMRVVCVCLSGIAKA